MKTRSLPFAILACLLLVVSVATIFAAETPIPPAPTQFVTDTANFMSPAAASALNSRLSAYEQQSGHQVLVYIGQTTGDAPLDDWAVRAFEKWKIGRKGMDDGLALFIMAQDHKLRIEVGYGLEGDVTDAAAASIINDIIVPRIKAGDQDGAVTAGIDAVTGVISGQGLPAATQQQQRRGGSRGQSRPLTLGQLIIYGIIGIVVLIIFITNPSLAIYLLMSILSGGGRGGDDRGGGFGGGGFSGGGGRSGGGGASGSW